MNPERLKKLQAQVAQVRIGGKGTPRRKKKIVHQTAATDDKKLQSTLKKLAVNPIQGIEEVNIFKNDQTVIVFNNPRTQASLASNTFAITGHSETKNIADMMRPELIQQYKRMAMLNSLTQNSRVLSTLGEENDDIPDLVQNFESQIEAAAAAAAAATGSDTVTKGPVEVVD